SSLFSSRRASTTIKPTIESPQAGTPAPPTLCFNFVTARAQENGSRSCSHLPRHRAAAHLARREPPADDSGEQSGLTTGVDDVEAAGAELWDGGVFQVRRESFGDV